MHSILSDNRNIIQDEQVITITITVWEYERLGDGFMRINSEKLMIGVDEKNDKLVNITFIDCSHSEIMRCFEKYYTKSTIKDINEDELSYINTNCDKVDTKKTG